VIASFVRGLNVRDVETTLAIFDTDGLTTQPGPQLVQLNDHRIGEFIDRYRATYPAAMKILNTDRAGLTAYLRFPGRASSADPALQPHRARLRRDPPPRQGHRPLPRRDQLHQHRLGRARPRLPRLAAASP
jgi:hypothetical protein